jgi:hypothetical protein
MQAAIGENNVVCHHLAAITEAHTPQAVVEDQGLHFHTQLQVRHNTVFFCTVLDVGANLRLR